jgi:uncharacterized protein
MHARTHHLLAALALIVALGASVPGRAVAATRATATGIPLDAPWKVAVYRLARTHFRHPAWGWQHSERNYRVGIALAKGDGLVVDTDVLFAAAFLHDMAAFPPYAKPGIDHGLRASQTSEAVLRAAGFPMAKYAAVAAAERTHMYDRTPGTDPVAIVLHDADSLDFLGAIGAARMLALTGEAAPDVRPAVRALRGFLRDVPPRLVTKTARRLARRRVAELRAFLDALDAESAGATAL